MRLPLKTAWQVCNKTLTRIVLSVAKLYCCFLVSIQMLAVLSLNSLMRNVAAKLITSTAFGDKVGCKQNLFEVGVVCVGVGVLHSLCRAQD